MSSTSSTESPSCVARPPEEAATCSPCLLELPAPRLCHYRSNYQFYCCPGLRCVQLNCPPPDKPPFTLRLHSCPHSRLRLFCLAVTSHPAYLTCLTYPPISPSLFNLDAHHPLCPLLSYYLASETGPYILQNSAAVPCPACDPLYSTWTRLLVGSNLFQRTLQHIAHGLPAPYACACAYTIRTPARNKPNGYDLSRLRL